MSCTADIFRLLNIAIANGFLFQLPVESQGESQGEVTALGLSRKANIPDYFQDFKHVLLLIEIKSHRTMTLP